MNSINIYSQSADERGERVENDFYPTEPEAVHALIQVERDRMKHVCREGGQLYECACGDGAISKVLEKAGFATHSTDLIDRGYGKHGIDFLQVARSYCNARVIRGVVTNPPYGDLAAAFIEHAFYLEMDYVAMLLKANYFHAQCRLDMRRRLPLARVYPLAWRLDFTGEGSPHTDCSWYVWEAGHQGHPLYMPPLERPADINQIDLFLPT